MLHPLKIGTRGSKLARRQANWVKSAVLARHPSIPVEIETIKTTGDKILNVPLARVGGKGLFVKEIEEALLSRRIDLAVHSMKDMPAEIPKGLCIGAVPAREIPNDVLISKNNCPLSGLPAGARIGTSSLRRASQLLCLRPDFKIIPLRGNLDTRIRKLETENLDAVVLAAAGIRRLALEGKITEYINPDTLIPAVGQGALCIEIRKNDPETRAVVSVLDHAETRAAITAERAFLTRLEGGCQVPMAAYGTIEKNRLSISGIVAALDGSTIYREQRSGPVSTAAAIGTGLAEALLDMGAGEILAKLNQEEKTS